MNEEKCYFCRIGADDHAIDCVICNDESAVEYTEGSRSARLGEGKILSNHSYFTKGWLHGMVDIAKQNR